MLHAALRKTEAYDHIGDDVRLIVQPCSATAAPRRGRRGRARLLEEFEKYGRDLGTRAQARMQKPAPRRGRARAA
ncbi:MAG: hypothetical protein R3F43_19865 [bacterium]